MGQAIAVDTISTVLGVIKPIAVNLNTDCTNKLTKDNHFNHFGVQMLHMLLIVIANETFESHAL